MYLTVEAVRNALLQTERLLDEYLDLPVRECISGIVPLDSDSLEVTVTMYDERTENGPSRKYLEVYVEDFQKWIDNNNRMIYVSETTDN